MKRSWRTLAACVLVVASSPVRGDGVTQQPFELVRSLRILQDRIVYGDAGAHVAQKAALARAAERLDQAADSVWMEPKNLTAAVAFVLGGGSPRVLKKLLARDTTHGMLERLLKGALAYAEGRTEEAGELLGGLDAAHLDHGIAGHIALVQAELAIRKDPMRAIDLLDQARLLSPGTLVEEAALRRQITLFAAAGNFVKFQATSAVYLRRFPKSIYAGAFKLQFATQIVAHEASQASIPRLEGMLAGLDPLDRRDLYLAIAKAGIARGRVELVRFAAAKAGQLADASSIEGTRSKLYEAAALVVSDDFEKGEAALKAISPEAMGREDVELLDAAKAVANAVRRTPAEDENAQPDPVGNTLPLKSVVAAQEAILEVDTLLQGAGK
jgi:chemotaxis protein MotC